MNTTSLIVEVLVVGLLVLTWLTLLILGLHHIDLESARAMLSHYEGWSASISIIAVALSYQLGWLAIRISYRPIRSRIEGIRKVEFGEGSNYDEIKFIVQAESPESVLRLLEKDRAVIRLSRTGIFNFSMLFIGFAIHQLIGAALACLALAALCFWQTIETYKSFYRKMRVQHGRIEWSKS